MKYKSFPLKVVLSATTGRLLCEIGQVYEILNHVTGDNLFTHVLPRAFKFASPLIKAQFPGLESAEKPEHLAKLNTLIEDAKARNESTTVACELWLKWIQEPGTCGLHSDYSVLSHEDSWLVRNPIEEAVSIFGKEKVVVIDATKGQP